MFEAAGREIHLAFLVSEDLLWSCVSARLLSWWYMCAAHPFDTVFDNIPNNNRILGLSDPHRTANGLIFDGGVPLRLQYMDARCGRDVEPVDVSQGSVIWEDRRHNYPRAPVPKVMSSTDIDGSLMKRWRIAGLSA